MQENEAWISKKELIIPIISIIVFLLLVSSASYAYYTQSVGSATGAANISNANLVVPRGCTFLSAATNCTITANNATTTAFTDTVITRAEMSQAYKGNSVAQATCNLNIGVQGTAGCKCNYTVNLVGTVSNTYLYDSMKVTINKGSTAQPLLPAEYQQVEYIASNGSQYIDTLFKANQNTRLEVKFQPTTITGAHFVAGGRQSYTANAFVFLVWTGSKVFSEYNNSGNVDTGYVCSVNQDCVVYKDKNTVYVNGELKTTHTAATFQTPVNMYLFGVNNNGTFDTAQPFKGKIYYARIYDNGSLERNFIPCYRVSDNVIGMYDTVHGEFFINKGSGAFTKGNNITEFDASSNFNKSGTITVATTGTAVYENYSVTLKGYNLDLSQNFLAGNKYSFYLRANPTCTVS